MSYIINKTDGTVLTTIQDGTTNTDIGLTLIGRNYTNYGQAQNDNFVRLLENFADTVPPGQSVGFSPIVGTLWWDTGNQRLKIYNGTAFISVSPLVGSSTAPTAIKLGDLWWDTVNQQLKAWTGTTWLLVGPAYTASQGKSGVFVETLADVSGNPRIVLNEYLSGNVVSVTSHDTFRLFSPTPVPGLSYINAGVNAVKSISSGANLTVSGISNLGDDTTVGGQLYLNWNNDSTPIPGSAVLPSTTGIYDIGSATKQFRSVYLNGNISLSANATISVANRSVILQNKNSNGNVEIYVNSIVGNTKSAYVDGINGLLYVSADPVDPFGVTTKQYVDSSVNTLNQTLSTALASTDGNVSTINSTLNNNIIPVQNNIATNILPAITANLGVLTSSLNSLSNQVTSDENNNATNFANVYSDLDSVYSTMLALAPLNSPTLTGNPTAPTPPAVDNSIRIATTAYVQRSASALATDYNYKINALSNSTSNGLLNGLNLKADINSPTLTGTPRAPTPTPTDNSTSIATTAFVKGALAQQAFNYTVSTNPPSGGNDGDFWFQVG